MSAGTFSAFPALCSFRISTTARAMTRMDNIPTPPMRSRSFRCAACRACSAAASSAAFCSSASRCCSSACRWSSACRAASAAASSAAFCSSASRACSSRLGLRLFLGEAGGLRFLFRLLLCQPRLFFHIGLEQNCQLPADHRPRALPVGIRVIHVSARTVGQAGGIDRQQKRLRGPDDADVVLCAVVAAVFVGDGRLVHIDVRLEIRVRAGASSDRR